MSAAEQQFELMRRLCAMADDISRTRSTVLSREAITVLRDQVSVARNRILDDAVPRLIDYEAVCLIETMAEITYARADKSQPREDRAMMYLNKLRVFMRGDLDMAERKGALQ